MMATRRMQLDELDYQIIKVLHANARASASEIARASGANQRTIRKRIDRLVEEDIIRLTAIINPLAFNSHLDKIDFDAIYGGSARELTATYTVKTHFV